MASTPCSPPYFLLLWFRLRRRGLAASTSWMQPRESRGWTERLLWLAGWKCQKIGTSLYVKVKTSPQRKTHQNATAYTAFLLATCLRVEDVDAILVLLSHGLPVEVRQSSGSMWCLHDVRRLHHLCQDRNPACAVWDGGKLLSGHLRWTWQMMSTWGSRRSWWPTGLGYSLVDAIVKRQVPNDSDDVPLNLQGIPAQLINPLEELQASIGDDMVTVTLDLHPTSWLSESRTFIGFMHPLQCPYGSLKLWSDYE